MRHNFTYGAMERFKCPKCRRVFNAGSSLQYWGDSKDEWGCLQCAKKRLIAQSLTQGVPSEPKEVAPLLTDPSIPEEW